MNTVTEGALLPAPSLSPTALPPAPCSSAHRMGSPRRTIVFCAPGPLHMLLPHLLSPSLTHPSQPRHKLPSSPYGARAPDLGWPLGCCSFTRASAQFLVLCLPLHLDPGPLEDRMPAAPRAEPGVQRQLRAEPERWASKGRPILSTAVCGRADPRQGQHQVPTGMTWLHLSIPVSGEGTASGLGLGTSGHLGHA